MREYADYAPNSLIIELVRGQGDKGTGRFFDWYRRIKRDRQN